MRSPLLLLLVIALLFFSCKHQVIFPGDKGNGTGTDSSGNSSGDTLVCFEGEILPIFQTSCAKSGCHDAGTHEEGYVLDSYQNITKNGIKPGNPNGSKIYEVIVSGEMPPSGNPKLTKDQVSLIKQWIVEGAKNTTNCNPCDTSVYTYSGAVQGIMSNNCISCHSGSLQNGGVDLSTYNGVKTVALNGKLIGTITHSVGFSPMPQGANQLNDCNITQIQKWIDAGAPNN